MQPPRLISALLLLVLLNVPFASADTIHVPADYSKIREAISAAQNGDTILVAAGTYHEILSFMGKAIIVQSQDGAETTVIDGNKLGTVVTFDNNETTDSVLDGFTLRNGTGSWREILPDKWGNCGGAVFCGNSSPTIMNNTIKDNYVACGGGGICITGTAAPHITNNTINTNRGGEYGGGIFCGPSTTALIEDNVLRVNECDIQGGGIICYECEPTILGNTLDRNTAILGGGIYTVDCVNVDISGNEIIGNISEDFGGGIQCNTSTGTIALNSISENSNGGIGCEGSELAIHTNTIFGNEVRGGIIASFDSIVEIRDNILNQNEAINYFAGGVWCGPNATIDHNIFFGNTAATRGGGVYCFGTPLITNNIFNSNSAGGRGGAICAFGNPNGNEEISNNTMIGNSAFLGGAIWCDRSPVIKDNFFQNNEAGTGGAIYAAEESAPVISGNTFEANTAAQTGGGMQLRSSTPTITNNTLVRNVAPSGGGIYCTDCTVTVTDNLIDDNMATVSGGGITLLNDESSVISNNRFVDNKAQDFGGGMYTIETYNCAVTNNTFVTNIAGQKGGAIASGFTTMVMTNTICWNDTAPDGAEICIDHTGFVVSHSVVQGGQAGIGTEPNSTLDWGAGNIDADPMFVSIVLRDLHLLYTSPCRDVGLNTSVVDNDDFEGDPRIAGSAVDIGADEFHTHLYCTGDFSPEGQIEAYIIGTPGSAPVGIFLGFGLLNEPLNVNWGTFYLESPWFLFGPLGTVGSLGVIMIPAELPRLPEAPYDFYLQALVKNKLTNLFTVEVRE